MVTIENRKPKSLIGTTEGSAVAIIFCLRDLRTEKVSDTEMAAHMNVEYKEGRGGLCPQIRIMISRSLHFYEDLWSIIKMTST